MTTLPVDVDFALLPSAQTVIQHFGPALLSMSEDENGYRVDGTSTIGIPLTGTLPSAGVVVAAVAAATGLAESVSDSKRAGAAAQMVQLAVAMKADRDSVGGGQWAQNVVQLVDRGILLEADKLVDPADPTSRPPLRPREGLQADVDAARPGGTAALVRCVPFASAPPWSRIRNIPLGIPLDESNEDRGRRLLEGGGAAAAGEGGVTDGSAREPRSGSVRTSLEVR